MPAFSFSAAKLLIGFSVIFMRIPDTLDAACGWPFDHFYMRPGGRI